MKTYIDLQDCHATQISGNDGDSKWAIKNTNGDTLYELPSEWNEKQVMEAIHFARKFELIAFNAGINFMKEKKNEEIINIRKGFEGFKQLMMDENLRLAFMLEEIHGEKE